jgi:hypothetical protein
MRNITNEVNENMGGQANYINVLLSNVKDMSTEDRRVLHTTVKTLERQKRNQCVVCTHDSRFAGWKYYVVDAVGKDNPVIYECLYDTAKKKCTTDRWLSVVLLRTWTRTADGNDDKGEDIVTYDYFLTNDDVPSPTKSQRLNS